MAYSVIQFVTVPVFVWIGYTFSKSSNFWRYWFVGALLAALIVWLDAELITGLKTASPFLASLAMLVAVRVLKHPTNGHNQESLVNDQQTIIERKKQRPSRSPVLTTIDAFDSEQPIEGEPTFIDQSFGDTFHDQLLKQAVESEAFSSTQIKVLESLIANQLQDSTGNDTLVFSDGAQFGEFKIETLIGRGAGASVYKAIAPSGDQVALKILNKVEMQSRFEREMDLVQRLAHPNIVTAYESEQTEGTSYISMELLDGPDLYQRVLKSGPLDWEATYTFILQIARALKQAHDRGLIHRDIKPANIILHGERVKLADLGVASTNENAPHSSEDPITQSKAVCGTPAFMAPEQASSTLSADERSDIYGLGVTWHFLLTGEQHIEGETITQQLANLINDQKVKILNRSFLPGPLWDIYSQMVAFDPKDRFQSADELIAALEEFGNTRIAIQEKLVRILLVEDSDFDVHLALQLLKRINQTVKAETATTMKEAIEFVTRETFDIILLDLSLPDSDGLDTVKSMTAAAPNTPVVVLSGRDDQKIELECLANGAQKYARKSALDAHLLERIVFMTISQKQRTT